MSSISVYDLLGLDLVIGLVILGMTLLQNVDLVLNPPPLWSLHGLVAQNVGGGVVVHRRFVQFWARPFDGIDQLLGFTRVSILNLW